MPCGVLADWEGVLAVQVLLASYAQVLGEVDEFNGALKRVLQHVTFNTDVVVSVFETNIRMLG